MDRLAPAGILRRVLPAPPILQQFPVECLVVDKFAGPRERVIAFKVCTATRWTPQRASRDSSAVATCGQRGCGCAWTSPPPGDPAYTLDPAAAPNAQQHEPA